MSLRLCSQHECEIINTTKYFTKGKNKYGINIEMHIPKSVGVGMIPVTKSRGLGWD